MSDEIKMEKVKPKVEQALIKKALGYSYDEVIEEYSVDENGETLTKKKVTTKNVPPDISAVKVLLELLQVSTEVDVSKLSDEELTQEIKRAIAILKEEKKENSDDGDCENGSD